MLHRHTVAGVSAAYHTASPAALSCQHCTGQTPFCLTVASHAGPQHAAVVPSDMHIPQTGTQSSDSLPSAGLQASSEDATPPFGSLAQVLIPPTWARILLCTMPGPHVTRVLSFPRGGSHLFSSLLGNIRETSHLHIAACTHLSATIATALHSGLKQIYCTLHRTCPTDAQNGILAIPAASSCIPLKFAARPGRTNSTHAATYDKCGKIFSALCTATTAAS